MHFMKVTQPKTCSLYVVKLLCISSFWVRKENSKGLWFGLHALLPSTVLIPCSGHSGVRSFMLMWSTKKDWFALGPQLVPIFLRPGICFLPTSGSVVETRCQFSSDVGTLSLFFSPGFDFSLHLSVSINAKYWKVQIDFPSQNMKGLFFKLQYFTGEYLWSICLRIKEELQTPPSDCQ